MGSENKEATETLPTETTESHEIVETEPKTELANGVEHKEESKEGEQEAEAPEGEWSSYFDEILFTRG